MHDYLARLHLRLAIFTMLVTATSQFAEWLQKGGGRASDALSTAAGDVASTALVALIIGWTAGVVATRPFVKRLETLTRAAREWDDFAHSRGTRRRPSGGASGRSRAAASARRGGD